MASDGILKPEEYAAYHKLVFRTAFDFLNNHFPPQDDMEWWIQVAKDSSEASCSIGGGKLVDGMLTAIGDYLDEEYKKRRGERG